MKLGCVCTHGLIKKHTSDSIIQTTAVKVLYVTWNSEKTCDWFESAVSIQNINNQNIVEHNGGCCSGCDSTMRVLSEYEHIG